MKFNDLRLGMWTVSILSEADSKHFTTIDLRKVEGGNRSTAYCKKWVFAEHKGKYVLFQEKDEVFGHSDFGLHTPVDELEERKKYILINCIFGDRP